MQCRPENIVLVLYVGVFIHRKENKLADLLGAFSSLSSSVSTYAQKRIKWHESIQLVFGGNTAVELYGQFLIQILIVALSPFASLHCTFIMGCSTILTLGLPCGVDKDIWS